MLAGIFLGREAFIRYNTALVLPPLLALVFIAGAFVAFDHRSPEAALSAYATGLWLGLATLLVAGLPLLRGTFRWEGRLAATIVRFAALAGPKPR